MKKVYKVVRGSLGKAKRFVHKHARPAHADNEPSRQPIFYIDSPVRGTVDTNEIVVSGWFIPAESTKVVGVRVKNDGKYHTVKYGIKRPDVAALHPTLDKDRTMHSGFSQTIQFRDGSLDIEVDSGHGYETIHSIKMFYSEEMLYDMFYNPDLAVNYAEHQNLLENKKAYFYESRLDGSYKRSESDPRLVAFYLPQFHPIPENNYAWGAGFTEWRNVTMASPRFVGHQQPILPQDFGFYDLRLEQVIGEQIDLAKKYGLYGFCFYYYWFSGKKILEHPLESFLKHKEWDFNFSICWANENWTKRWDGREQEVIIAQEYADDDPLRFIQDVEDILLDPRYIREAGKPVLTVYRAQDLGDPKRYTEVWREYFRKKHKLELRLVSVMGFDSDDPRKYGFDAGLDFAPQTAFFKDATFPQKKFPFIDVSRRLLDRNFEGSVADYRQLARNNDLYTVFDFPTYKSVTPAWDNDARRKGKGFIFHNTSPDLYAQWLSRVLAIETKQKKSPIVFVNAWNEWAEGAVLEPTLHSGHTVLNRTVEVLSQYSADSSNQKRWPMYGITRQSTTSLAVVVHVFYEKEWRYIEEKLSALGEAPYDLFVSINKKDAHLIDDIHKKHKQARVFIAPNRGRDVLPFLFLARRLADVGYEYVLKLHTKKSQHRADGHKWFEELVDNLLPNATRVDEVLQQLKDGSGIVGPAGHYVSLERYMGGNSASVRMLLGNTSNKKQADEVMAAPGHYGFFASTMFWARLDAIKPLLDLHLLPEDFESEKGQIDGTFAHAIERVLGVMPVLGNFSVCEVSADGVSLLKPEDGETNYEFAP